MDNKKIEIPFGAKDSELCGWEYTIPEGMEAVVEGGKVIVRRKESEDERIRKNCIHFLELQKTHHADTSEIDDCIAYLEKQKEPEHFELKEGHWYICHHPFCCRADHLTVKEGERFMCEKDGVVKGFVINEPEKYFIECSAPAPMEDEQKEQKPAEWSEEDEKMRNKIIGLLSGFLYPNSLYGEDAIECIVWLKSLRPSKDCSDCAKHLEGYISGRCDAENKLLEQFGALITPEDELHIKPRWKPSEEQMEALKEAVYQLDSSEYSSGIDSLYNDLKNYFKI